ncbi:UNVERIFIED_CONTAM: Serine/arginine-rich splicing factor a [Sesamum angustifolium]|uniref:Serine/arginine-rich splicing factor a n=1 Tax=Sesamum angustifolium TaxID=2727405 RepID=A0AAW2J7C0_9LAMI
MCSRSIDTKFSRMSYSRRSRYSDSLSPYRRYSRSVSRSRSRSRSRSHVSSDAENPGNNLYVTGLSTRVTKRDLEKHFSSEGKVEDVHLVVDPWTRESRGFGFVTMSTLEEADRCIKYLDRSVLEGRVITVEKARRRRGRTPTPGKYLGLRTVHGDVTGLHGTTPDDRYSRGRSASVSPDDSRRSYSRSVSPGRSRSYSRSVSQGTLDEATPGVAPHLPGKAQGGRSLAASPQRRIKSLKRSASHDSWGSRERARSQDSRSSRSHSRSPSASSSSRSGSKSASAEPSSP